MSGTNKELLDRIKDEQAILCGYQDFENWKSNMSVKFDSNRIDSFLMNIAERYATEKAKESINFPENKNEQINYFLVNVLRHLDAEQALTLAKNLIGRIPQTEYFTRSEVESCIKDSLQAAAENANILWTKDGIRLKSLEIDSRRVEIDKSSITDTKNIKIK